MRFSIDTIDSTVNNFVNKTNNNFIQVIELNNIFVSKSFKQIIMKNHTTTLIGKSKVSHILPLLRLIASEWNLNLSSTKGFNIAKKILINSATNN